MTGQMLKGTDVLLTVRTQSGTDAANRPTYTDSQVTVKNVLIGQPETEEIVNEVNLSGKRIAYVLGIPKGDTHDWTDTFVTFWGMKFRTIGIPMTAEQANVPLQWGQKVRVEYYGKDQGGSR